MENNEGGPAFPQPCTENGYAANTPCGMAGGGMSMRDYFAEKAMIAYLTHPAFADNDVNVVARWSYEMADSMLKARNA